MTPLEAHFELLLEAPFEPHHALLTGVVNVLEPCRGGKNRQNCAPAVMNAP
jgi:hypothetical protein